MGRRKIALGAFKNLCAFIGAITLFSYFYNWTVDLRHWYVTVGSAFVCLIVWAGFYANRSSQGCCHAFFAEFVATRFWMAFACKDQGRITVTPNRDAARK